MGTVSCTAIEAEALTAGHTIILISISIRSYGKRHVLFVGSTTVVQIKILSAFPIHIKFSAENIIRGSNVVNNQVIY